MYICTRTHTHTYIGIYQNNMNKKCTHTHIYIFVFAQTNMQLTFHEMNVDLLWQFRRGFLMVPSGLTPAGVVFRPSSEIFTVQIALGSERVSPLTMFRSSIPHIFQI